MQLEIIRGLRGVIHAFYLDKDILEELRREESTVRAMGNIEVDNRGFNEALKRESVICIVKDPRFRPPPEPTVVLETSDGEIIGEEVFPFTMHKYENRTDVVWLSDGFVLFPQIMAKGGEQFVMPPVSFPELNESNGCKDVVSCSPAPTSDLMIKKHYGLVDNPKIASVLVAFNRIKRSRFSGGGSAPPRFHSLAVLRQTRTGQWAILTTVSATEPIIALLRLVRPKEPQTTRSAFQDSLTISSAGRPITTFAVTSMPFSSAFSTT
jgi:hypothetical protein